MQHSAASEFSLSHADSLHLNVPVHEDEEQVESIGNIVDFLFLVSQNKIVHVP